MSDLPGCDPLLQGTRVLVTGATGKVGRHLVAALMVAGASVSILTRAQESARQLWPSTNIHCRQGDLTDPDSLVSALDEIDLVFHLASYSPRPDEPDVYGAMEHWSVTADGTKHLMDAAHVAGVGRLVYLSSVKAMGDAAGALGRPADETTPACPDTLYGRAKLEAERIVLAGAEGGRMHVTVLRLPMVYGLEGKGNLFRMLDAVARRRFPPWPPVVNRRSAVHVGDTVAAALLVATDRRAAGETYLVTDDSDYSTRWIYEQICTALGRRIPSWSLPLWCWRVAAEVGSVGEHLTDKAMPLTANSLEKLSGDAWFSSRKIREHLSFRSQYALEAEIPAMVGAYLDDAESARR